MRDFNHDLLHNPWDRTSGRSHKLLVDCYATLWRPWSVWAPGSDTLESIDARLNLSSVRSRGNLYGSEVTQGYTKRLLKYQDKLFTFLNHDGVPWNNNNAERAVKKFADYRELVDGQFSEAG